MSKNSRQIFLIFLAYYGMTCVSNAYFLFGPYYESLGATPQRAGLFLSAFYMVTLFCRPLGSIVMERLDIRRTLIGSALLCAAATAGIALTLGGGASLLVFRDHVIEKHIGGYSANMEQLYSTTSAPEKEREKPRPSSAPKMSTREKQELDHMEADIAALEEQIAQIDAQMQAHTDFREIEALSAQRMDLEQQMEGKMERWMELSERKAQIDAYYRK